MENSGWLFRAASDIRDSSSLLPITLLRLLGGKNYSEWVVFFQDALKNAEVGSTFEIDADTEPLDETCQYGESLFGEVIYNKKMGKLTWSEVDFTSLDFCYVIDHPTHYQAYDGIKVFLDLLKHESYRHINDAVLMFMYTNPDQIPQYLKNNQVLAWGTVREWGGCLIIRGLSFGSEDSKPLLFWRHISIGGPGCCLHGI